MPAAARIVPHRAGPSSNGPKAILLFPVIAKFSPWGSPESGQPSLGAPLLVSAAPSRVLSPKFSGWETCPGMAKLGDYRLYLQFLSPTSGIFTFQAAYGQLWIT